MRHVSKLHARAGESSEAVRTSILCPCPASLGLPVCFLHPTPKTSRECSFAVASTHREFERLSRCAVDVGCFFVNHTLFSLPVFLLVACPFFISKLFFFRPLELWILLFLCSSWKTPLSRLWADFCGSVGGFLTPVPSMWARGRTVPPNLWLAVSQDLLGQ